MKINIAKSSGFCFGVKRAIEISKALAGKKTSVRVLGDIVHNSFVVKDLHKLGIRKIKSITPVKKNRILIIRAHGAPKNVIEKAIKAGYRIIDATCPKVKDIYRIARKLEKSGKVIIIGDNNHDEVKGIAGQLRIKPITVASPRRMPLKALSRLEKAYVITQSTQSIENIEAVMDRLRKIIPDIRLYNTTCRTTIVKQEEIRSMPLKNDIMLIIGSRTSANTKRLFEISKKINRNTHWIESAKDIRSAWFNRIKTTGIMAGASTPNYVTDEVVKRLRKM